MSDVRWIKTDKHVFGAIWREHHEELIPFSSYSNPSGDCPLGNGKPEMLTEWGLKGADYPIVKHHDRNGEHSYYIALVTKPEEP